MVFLHPAQGDIKQKIQYYLAGQFRLLLVFRLEQ